MSELHNCPHCNAQWNADDPDELEYITPDVLRDGDEHIIRCYVGAVRYAHLYRKCVFTVSALKHQRLQVSVPYELARAKEEEWVRHDDAGRFCPPWVLMRVMWSEGELWFIEEVAK